MNIISMVMNMGSVRQISLWSCLLLIVPALCGCVTPGREMTDGTEKARATIEAFMNEVIAHDYEEAFEYLDIDSLVNLGRPQGEIYRSLDPPHQSRYRKDFIEGVYLFLFRKVAPGEEIFQTLVQDNGLSVYVTGRGSKKRLRFILADREGDLKIVGIEKAADETGGVGYP